MLSTPYITCLESSHHSICGWDLSLHVWNKGGGAAQMKTERETRKIKRRNIEWTTWLNTDHCIDQCIELQHTSAHSSCSATFSAKHRITHVVLVAAALHGSRTLKSAILTCHFPSFSCRHIPTHTPKRQRLLSPLSSGSGSIILFNYFLRLLVKRLKMPLVCLHLHSFLKYIYTCREWIYFPVFFLLCLWSDDEHVCMCAFSIFMHISTLPQVFFI